MTRARGAALRTASSRFHVPSALTRNVSAGSSNETAALLCPASGTAQSADMALNAATGPTAPLAADEGADDAAGLLPLLPAGHAVVRPDVVGVVEPPRHPLARATARAHLGEPLEREIDVALTV